MNAYFRHSGLFLFSGPVVFGTALLGGAWTWLGMVLPFLAMQAGDFVWPKDLRDRTYRYPSILNALLFLHLLWAVLVVLVLCWVFSQPALGRSIGSMLGLALSVGVLGSTNYVVAHELIHRRSRLSVFIGNCLLALVADTQFAIAHLYEHHKHVCTPADSASARRGESLYAFVLRSSYGQYVAAMHIEATRLHAQGLSAWHVRNRFLRGQCMTASVFLGVAFVFGWQALLGYALSIVFAKLLYETVNYIQHYGLLRVPGTAVEPRHSWDCTASFSGAFLFNLTRHADHHARADVPFWALRAEPKSPQHTQGYALTMMLAFFPPIWFGRMDSQLAQWDAQFATPQERHLIHGKKDAP